MPKTEKPTCFVIAPIGQNDSDIRERSDKVLRHIFKKALANKYKVIRGDEIDRPTTLFASLWYRAATLEQ